MQGPQCMHALQVSIRQPGRHILSGSFATDPAPRHLPSAQLSVSLAGKDPRDSQLPTSCRCQPSQSQRGCQHQNITQRLLKAASLPSSRMPRFPSNACSAAQLSPCRSASNWPCEQSLMDTQPPTRCRCQPCHNLGVCQHYRLTSVCAKWPACQAAGGPQGPTQQTWLCCTFLTLQVRVSLL